MPQSARWTLLMGLAIVVVLAFPQVVRPGQLWPSWLWATSSTSSRPQLPLTRQPTTPHPHAPAMPPAGLSAVAGARGPSEAEAEPAWAHTPLGQPHARPAQETRRGSPVFMPATGFALVLAILVRRWRLHVHRLRHKGGLPGTRRASAMERGPLLGHSIAMFGVSSVKEKEGSDTEESDAETPAAAHQMLTQGIPGVPVKVPTNPDSVELDTTPGLDDAAATLEPAEEEGVTGFQYWRWRVGLFLLAGLCATNFPLIKLLENSHYGGAELSAVRFGIALMPFLPQMIKEAGPVLRNEGNARACAIGGVEVGLWCVLGYVTQAIGMDMTSPAKGAFIQSLCMVVCPIANGFAGKKVWAAVVLALMGTGVLEGLGSQILSGQATSIEAGDPWMLGAALGFGLMFARMEHHVVVAGDDPASVFKLSMWQMLPLFGCMVGWAAWEMDSWPALFSTGAMDPMAGATFAIAALPAILFMGLITTAFVLWAQTAAMGEVPSSEAGVIFATEPIFAAVWASLMLGDSLTAEEAMGGTLIIVACLATQLKLEDEGEEAAAAQSK